MRVIIVSGSVCSGKTTLAKGLAKKLGFRYVDVNRIVGEYNLSESYDRKRKCDVVDVKKLNKALIDKINRLEKDLKKGVIIDSHLSHHLSRKYANLCIVAKCDLRVLERRLKKRGYNKEKIRENMDCEIFDVCLNEAKENKHKVIVIDTTKGINMSKISKGIKNYLV